MKAPLRTLVWGVGVAGTLLWYCGAAVRFPGTTAIGTETPLCPLADVTLEPLQSESGAWVFSTQPREGPDYAPPTPPASPSPEWPRLSVLSPRRLVFGAPYGTWSADGWGLRRAWRFAALGWGEDRRLWTTLDGETWSEPALVLDLKTGRTEVKPEGWENPYRFALYEDYGDPFVEDESLVGTLTSTLEKQPADFAAERERSYQIGDRRVSLLWAGDEQAPRALYAASDEAAPRLLRLAADAEPLALARDGKTLFFKRERMLWRLDFRKPLPELLDEVELPSLPQPPLD